MAESLETRRPIVRVVILLMLIGLGIRIIQVAIGDPPQAQASPMGEGPRSLWRVEWLSRCGAADGAGLYAVSDAPCHPSRVVSLNWLQGQLMTPGLLAAGEYLERKTHPANPMCGAVVLSGPNGIPSGWLCADVGGLYRLDADGRDSGGRWQIWSDGTWAQVG